MHFTVNDESLSLRPYLSVCHAQYGGKLYIRGWVPGMVQALVDVRPWNPANPICAALETNDESKMLLALSGKGVPAWVRDAAAYFSEVAA